MDLNDARVRFRWILSRFRALSKRVFICSMAFDLPDSGSRVHQSVSFNLHGICNVYSKNVTVIQTPLCWFLPLPTETVCWIVGPFPYQRHVNHHVWMLSHTTYIYMCVSRQPITRWSVHLLISAGIEINLPQPMYKAPQPCWVWCWNSSFS